MNFSIKFSHLYSVIFTLAFSSESLFSDRGEKLGRSYGYIYVLGQRTQLPCIQTLYPQAWCHLEPSLCQLVMQQQISKTDFGVWKWIIDVMMALEGGHGEAERIWGSLRERAKTTLNNGYQKHGPIVGFPDSSVGKESACNEGNSGLIAGSGRSTGEGIGYPLQYSWVFLVPRLVRKLPAMQETWV